jgi:hypothetical protein
MNEAEQAIIDSLVVSSGPLDALGFGLVRQLARLVIASQRDKLDPAESVRIAGAIADLSKMLPPKPAPTDGQQYDVTLLDDRGLAVLAALLEVASGHLDLEPDALSVRTVDTLRMVRCGLRERTPEEVAEFTDEQFDTVVSRQGRWQYLLGTDPKDDVIITKDQEISDLRVECSVLVERCRALRALLDARGDVKDAQSPAVRFATTPPVARQSERKCQSNNEVLPKSTAD